MVGKPVIVERLPDQPGDVPITFADITCRRQRALREIERLADAATNAQPVFYADEVDIHLNPKIGRDWMPPGFQRRVVTPGKNETHYLAGASSVRDRSPPTEYGDECLLNVLLQPCTARCSCSPCSEWFPAASPKAKTTTLAL